MDDQLKSAVKVMKVLLSPDTQSFKCMNRPVCSFYHSYDVTQLVCRALCTPEDQHRRGYLLFRFDREARSGTLAVSRVRPLSTAFLIDTADSPEDFMTSVVVRAWRCLGG
jgi:hypothetical protein